MGRGGAGSGHGNVRERSEIVEREAFGVKERGKLAVGDASCDGDGASLGIERNDFVERCEGEEGIFAVGYVVETVTRAEDFELGMIFDEVSDLFLRFGGVEIFCAVFEVASPVGELVGRGPSEETRNGGDGDGCGGES